MSITAFPVLARILTDYRMSRTKLGVLALSCAAIDDVTAWCLLAFVVGIAKAEMGQGLLVAAGALAFITFMFLLGRPILQWVAVRWEGEAQTRQHDGSSLDLLSAITAEFTDHAIFGASAWGRIPQTEPWREPNTPARKVSPPAVPAASPDRLRRRSIAYERASGIVL